MKSAVATFRLDLLEVGLLLDELFRVERLSLDSSAILARLIDWRVKQGRQATAPEPEQASPSSGLLDVLGLEDDATTEDAIAKVLHLVDLARGAIEMMHGDEVRQAAIDEGAGLARELEVAASDFERELLTKRLADWARDTSPPRRSSSSAKR